MSGIRVGGTWRVPTTVHVKVGGQWRVATQAFAKIDGVWRNTTFASPPDKPVMVYVSTGVFAISNYNSSLVYEATYVVGSGGTATLNTVNGRYTLSGTWSGFNVISRYAAGAPASNAGYMERKPYSYSCRQVGYSCCSSCNCNCYLDAGCYCNPSGSPCSNPSWGQCGCPGPMCWTYYNGVVCNCQTCCSTCYNTVCDVLVSEPGYTNSGTEWYKAV